MRPGIVDPRTDPAVLALQKERQGALRMYQQTGLGAVMNMVYAPIHSPTPWLGKFLVDLAMRDGEPLKGGDLEDGGRIVGNKAAKRLSKEWESEGR